MSPVDARCFEPIPRERWAEHPHYPSQVLLLGSHQSFRKNSKTLVAAGSLSLTAKQQLFEQWQRSMRSHERYEESKLYPFLRRRFGVSTTSLEHGHEVLHTIEADLRNAHDAQQEGRWNASMGRYDVVLHEHLRDEEDLVIPCLLALSPREFSRYYHGSTWELLSDTPACACS